MKNPESKTSDAWQKKIKELQTERSLLGNTKADHSRRNYLDIYIGTIQDYLDGNQAQRDVMRELQELITVPGGPSLNKRLDVIASKRTQREEQDAWNARFAAGGIALLEQGKDAGK
jgi:hypothetical protein